VPVQHQGRHAGSVEFGMSFGAPFLARFQEKYGVDLVLHTQEGRALAPYASTLGERRVLGAEALEEALAGDPVHAQLQLGEMPVAVSARPVLDFSGEPIGVMQVVLDRSSFAATLSESLWSSLTIALAVLAGGVVVAVLLGRGIVRPLRGAVAALEDISAGEGDLTRRLPEEGQDEVAALARAFNGFAEKIRALVQQVAGALTEIAGAVREMETYAERSRDGMQRQHAEIDQVATSVNEMSATVHEVANSAAGAAEAARDAEQQTGSAHGEVQQTVTAISGLASEVERASEVIHRLEGHSENISTVLDVISSVAEQTNLLALNAAIEAARAGEHGRGFAVVADEVRTLASRTHASTVEIRELIEKLQKGARDAVEVMGEGRTMAADSVSQAEKAGQALDAITSAVSTINEMNVQIASATEEQSAVAEEINKNISNINQAANDSEALAAQTSTASRRIAGLEDQVTALIGHFRT
jgi:methyl-accepting chemotaxis protein